MSEDGIKKIRSVKLQLYLKLCEELKDGPKRVPYDQLAHELGCARSTITENVGKLMSDGVIGLTGPAGSKDQKLCLIG